MSKFKKEIVIVSSAVAVFLLLFVFFRQGAAHEFDPHKGKDVKTEAAETIEVEVEADPEEERYHAFMVHHMKELNEIGVEFDRTFDFEYDEAYEAQVYGIYDEDRTNNFTRLLNLMGTIDKLTIPASVRPEHDRTMEELNDIWFRMSMLPSYGFTNADSSKTYFNEVDVVQSTIQGLLTRYAE